MSTITDGTTTITPLLVLGYEATRQGRNIIHPIIGRPDPDVTLAPAALRTGTLSLLFKDEPTAAGCMTMHAAAAVFTVDRDDLPGASMRYVVAGRIGVTLDPATLLRCVVTVDFQEVAP
ncbi:hypothetical protein EV379_0912 [Microterricola gilva]|uniref:Uncharacterized protein n=1 Tax=Microterricola gilva TaxID=393267 RepID=A0A4Q8AL64_9MICO|nr:hypothetical protein [Microterricola gilva]RZU64609.1 hypothetical protein EV379_0912 [Microterricola gilva]